MSDTSKTISIRIAIDIPVDIAADTLRQLEPFVARLTSRPVGETNIEELGVVVEDEAEAARKAEIRAHYDEQKRQFVRNGVQAFRIFRRIKDDFGTPAGAYRVIASRFEWPAGIVPGIISKRRKQVNEYLKRRRTATAIRMAYDGHTNHQIAERIGVAQPTVSRMLRQARQAMREVGNE